MTTEHLKVVLNSARDSEMLWQMAEEFVRAEVPVEVVEGIRLGRMTALRKPTDGVRGIVVGDTFRRAVSRAVAQQIATSVEPPLHSSMLCPLVRAQSASDMPSKPSLTSIQTAPSCQSTGLGRLIWCQERRCSQVCATWREGTHSFLLWPNSTGDLHSTSGRMMRGSATPFLKGKGENKATPDAGALLSGTTQFTCCCAGDPAAHRMPDGLPRRHLSGLTARTDRNCAS